MVWSSIVISDEKVYSTPLQVSEISFSWDPFLLQKKKINLLRFDSVWAFNFNRNNMIHLFNPCSNVQLR